MKSSFAKKAATETAPAPAPEQSADRTLATRTSPGVPQAVSHKGRADTFGEWLPGDSKLPHLNIVQKSSASELLEAFSFGDLVFAKRIKVADAETPLTVVPIVMGKDYQQKVPFGKGQGVVYKTAQDVLDNGGTLDYTKEAVQEQIYFGPRAHIEFGVLAPNDLEEDDLNFFPFTAPDGSRWATALMTVSSSGFTSLAKELETLRRHNLTMIEGLIYGTLELRTKYKQQPGQEWYIPIAKLVKTTPPALVEFLDAVK
jgi:hypothetical protein